MSLQNYQRDLVGIVGGMGPLASTAFLSTMYDLTLGRVEQDAGRFILYSDPCIPDRTEAFLSHRDDLVFEPFVEILCSLERLHVKKIILCCVTLHYLLPRLPASLQKLIISLIDPIFMALQERRECHLLLCTNATLQLNIFQKHPLWERCSKYILLPNAQDQETIHALIYHLKAGVDPRIVAATVQTLLDKYNAGSFIAGCTEFHLLSRYLASVYHGQQPYGCIDPLTLIAQKLAEEC